MEDIGNFVSIICINEARIEGILDKNDLTNGIIVVKNGKIFTCLLFNYGLFILLSHIESLLPSSLSSNGFWDWRKKGTRSSNPTSTQHPGISNDKITTDQGSFLGNIQRTRKTCELRFGLRRLSVSGNGDHLSYTSGERLPVSFSAQDWSKEQRGPFLLWGRQEEEELGFFWSKSRFGILIMFMC